MTQQRQKIRYIFSHGAELFIWKIFLCFFFFVCLFVWIFFVYLFGCLIACLFVLYNSYKKAILGVSNTCLQLSNSASQFHHKNIWQIPDAFQNKFVNRNILPIQSSINYKVRCTNRAPINNFVHWNLSSNHAESLQ